MNYVNGCLIKSISFSQEEILKSIIDLYIPGGVLHCDVTYAKGGFYNNIPKPNLKYDLLPQSEDTVKADCRALPLADGALESLVFDPPFLASWRVTSQMLKIEKYYSSIRGIKNLLKMYEDSIIEFSRVIQNNGVLIVKCQDTIYANKNYFNHITIHDYAKTNGFIALDLFILLAKSRFIGSGTQRSARKFHSYFWVFKKRRIGKENANG